MPCSACLQPTYDAQCLAPDKSQLHASMNARDCLPRAAASQANTNTQGPDNCGWQPPQHPRVAGLRPALSNGHNKQPPGAVVCGGLMWGTATHPWRKVNGILLPGAMGLNGALAQSPARPKDASRGRKEPSARNYLYKARHRFEHCISFAISRQERQRPSLDRRRPAPDNASEHRYDTRTASGPHTAVASIHNNRPLN